MTSVSRTSVLPRAYLRAERRLRSLLGVVKGTFDGVWLGVMPPAQLDALDDLVYRRRARYSHEEYNRTGLWTWEQRAVDRYFTRACRVVVTAAGGGREVMALLDQGFDAVGFECNPQLVAVGRRMLAAAGHGDRLRPCGRHRWPEQAGTCDAVVVGWGSYTHISGRQRRVQFLRDAGDHLTDGGVVLLSFWTVTGPTVYLRTVARVGTAIRRLARRPAVECGDTLSQSYVHFFTPAAVADELAAAGFELLEFHDGEYGVAVGAIRTAPADSAGREA
jgi:hypothetical protein